MTAILSENEIKSVTVVRMEVPCCCGIENAVKTALQACGKNDSVAGYCDINRRHYFSKAGVTMREKDREKDYGFATLATLNADNTPYCIPVSVILHDHVIYFHSAKDGLRLENIVHNTHVCISGVRHIKLGLVSGEN